MWKLFLDMFYVWIGLAVLFIFFGSIYLIFKELFEESNNIVLNQIKKHNKKMIKEIKNEIYEAKNSKK